MKYIIISAAMLLSISLHAQTLKVLDAFSLEGVPNTALMNRSGNLHIVTDESGVADISAFKNQDTLYIHHTGYQSVRYSFEDLEKKNFKIFLSQKSYDLDEIVLSAKRFEEKKDDVPNQIQVLRSSDLQFMNQQNMADVVSQTGNVLVQKSQQGGGSPIIRGFETNKVLMVVDGVRMNNAIYRGGHLQNIITIDNNMMEKVEIVYGPGSVVYGSDALGGVMHFYTRKPKLSYVPGKRIFPEMHLPDILL